MSRTIYVLSPNNIKKGKMPGGLKGLTMSRDQVVIRLESYLICAYVAHMYPADEEMKEEKCTEEGEKRRILHRDDRNRVY